MSRGFSDSLSDVGTDERNRISRQEGLTIGEVPPKTRPVVQANVSKDPARNQTQKNETGFAPSIVLWPGELIH